MKVRWFGTTGGVLCWLTIGVLNCTHLAAQEYAPSRASGHVYYATGGFADSGAIGYPLGGGGGGAGLLGGRD